MFFFVRRVLTRRLPRVIVIMRDIRYLLISYDRKHTFDVSRVVAPVDTDIHGLSRRRRQTRGAEIQRPGGVSKEASNRID
jgi:hypothetical protein